MPSDTDNPPNPKSHDNKRAFLHRLSGIFKSEPKDQEDMREILERAKENGLLTEDTYQIIIRSIAFSKSMVGDIMTARSRMDMLDIEKPLQEQLPFIIEKAHSRFPVFEGKRDNVIGILLAKDLLHCMANPSITLRQLLRPAYFVPETKHLNALLAEFRLSRNHIAMVIDEHGSVCGLLTMEDLLEEIVGDILDETDDQNERTIFPENNLAWRVMGETPIQTLNETLQSHIPDEEHDTIGGWMSAQLEHIPKRGETITYQGLRMRVIKADNRRVLWLHIKQIGPRDLES